jgi:hypothetical protein
MRALRLRNIPDEVVDRLEPLTARDLDVQRATG